MTRRHFLASAAALAASPAAGIRTPLHPLGAGSPAFPYRRRLGYIRVSGDCWWDVAAGPTAGAGYLTLKDPSLFRAEAVALFDAAPETGRSLVLFSAGAAIAYQLFRVYNDAAAGTRWTSSSGPAAVDGAITSLAFDGSTKAISADGAAAGSCSGTGLLAVMRLGARKAASPSAAFAPWRGRICSLSCSYDGAATVDAFPVLLRDGTPALWDAVSGAPIPSLGTGAPAFP